MTLPDADVWKWTCHLCGYFVESVDEEEMRRLRTEHLREENERAMRQLDARDCDAINALIPDPGNFNYGRGR